jgi:hypothetical protein
MKKRTASDNSVIVPETPVKHNPVAKFAGRFNKAKVFSDGNVYNRKVKLVKQEVSPSVYHMN